MLNKYFPEYISNILWGNRKQFGFIPDINDLDWKVWEEKGYSDFYINTQHKGVGKWVANLSYPVISRLNFDHKRVVEVGPGIMRHLSYMNTRPEKYVICDVAEKFLEVGRSQLEEMSIPCESILLKRKENFSLPIPNNSFDVVLLFNSLEHLNPIDEHLMEFQRILKHNGQIVGGIPCEGGLAWGLGRFLTTRRYVHKNYKINYDKIICWEHPNFADFIIDRLDAHFKRDHLKLHPFSWLPMDFNLVASFIYTRS